MTNEEILARELTGEELDFVLCNIINFQDAMEAARQDEREKAIIECKNLLLKLMHDMTHVNSYPSKAVPHATILELPQLMGIKREDEREKMAGDAVAFMEWAAGAGWQTYDGPDSWICPQENRRAVTTAELYKLFKPKQ